MPPRERKPTFVSLNVTPAARDELREATLALISPVGRRVSMSDVLVAALRIARAHNEEWARLLGGSAADRCPAATQSDEEH